MDERLRAYALTLSDSERMALYQGYQYAKWEILRDDHAMTRVRDANGNLHPLPPLPEYEFTPVPLK